jgi:hypothetical protein
MLNIIKATLLGSALMLLRVDGYAERQLWNSRQRGRALCQVTRVLFEPLCF